MDMNYGRFVGLSNIPQIYERTYKLRMANCKDGFLT